MVDTEAQYSVLNKPTEPLSQKTSLVQGATGSKVYRWTSKCQVDLGRNQVTHSFLVIPECPDHLLGRDLLTKVQAHIHFVLDSIKVMDSQGQLLHVLTLSVMDEHRLFAMHGTSPPTEWPHKLDYWLRMYPQAWAEIAGVGLAAHRAPVVVEVKPLAQPIRVRQYSVSTEARKGIAPHINRLLEAGILKPCHSIWNTHFFPLRNQGEKITGQSRT